MQTEIRYAYSKAAELWQLVLSLSSYAGMHPVNCDDSTAEYLTRGSTELWQRLTNLRQDFEPLDELRQLSFREPCEFGSRDYWLEATLRTIGHQTHHWCRQVVVCRNSPGEFNAVCPVTTELETAVQRRLLSEQAQLLRDCKTYLTSQPEQAARVPDTQLPSKPEPPQPKRYRKKPAVPAEKTQEEIAFGFLLLWHKYGTENFHTDPVPKRTEWQQWMAERNAGKPGPSPSTFSLMFKDKFGDHAKYVNACGNGTLETKLALGNGEAARVYQQQRQRERTTTDPEQDLD